MAVLLRKANLEGWQFTQGTSENKWTSEEKEALKEHCGDLRTGQRLSELRIPLVQRPR